MESTLIKRVLNNLKERREKILRGEINCIPSPFPRFSSEFVGIEQGMYYLITGGTKASKTQITSYLFLFHSIMYSYYHPDKITLKVFYYPLEETPETITIRFMSYLLNKLSNNTIRISPTDLQSTSESKVLSKEILDILESEEYMNIFSHFEKCIDWRDSRNPTGVWKDLKAYANESGETVYKNIKIKDEFENEKILKKYDYYIPKNKNEYVFIIVDHVGNIETERGLSLRESINKLSEYMVTLRNNYKYIPILIQQQNINYNIAIFKNKLLYFVQQQYKCNNLWKI